MTGLLRTAQASAIMAVYKFNKPKLSDYYFGGAVVLLTINLNSLPLYIVKKLKSEQLFFNILFFL